MRPLLLLLGALGLFAPAQAQQCELTDGVVRPAPALRRWLGEPARILRSTAAALALTGGVCAALRCR